MPLLRSIKIYGPGNNNLITEYSTLDSVPSTCPGGGCNDTTCESLCFEKLADIGISGLNKIENVFNYEEKVFTSNLRSKYGVSVDEAKTFFPL